MSRAHLMQNIDFILDRETKAIRHFFQFDFFQVSPLPDWIDDARVDYWDRLLFDLHYLPKIFLDQPLHLPSWIDRPSKYFYRKIDQGELKPASKELPGKWILIDARDKPPKKRVWINADDARLFQMLGWHPKDYLKKNKQQPFEKEYLQAALQEKGYGSRFCFSIHDVDEFKPRILEVLRLDEKSKIRLPYFIEYNYLGNVFYHQWATTKTWEWFEDTLGDEHHLAGGSGSVGCLGWDPLDFWSTILTFRPVIEL